MDWADENVYISPNTKTTSDLKIIESGIMGDYWTYKLSVSCPKKKYFYFYGIIENSEWLFTRQGVAHSELKKISLSLMGFDLHAYK